jgi:transposase
VLGGTTGLLVAGLDAVGVHIVANISVTMELFEEWFENKLLPQLHAGQVVVMDNASIHRSDIVKKLCLTRGIQRELLPPCSPDLNPIEGSFNALKQWIKRTSGWRMCLVTSAPSWRTRSTS